MNIKKYAPDTIELFSSAFNQVNKNRSYLTLAIKFNIFITLVFLAWLASFGVALLPMNLILKALFVVLDIVFGLFLFILISEIFPVGFIDIVVNRKKPSFSSLLDSASKNIMFIVFLSLVSLGLGLAVIMLNLLFIFPILFLDIFLPFFNLTTLVGSTITAPIFSVVGYIPVLMVFRYFTKKKPPSTLFGESFSYVRDHLKPLYFIALGQLVLIFCLGSMGLGGVLLPFVMLLVIVPFIQVMSPLLVINFVSRNP